MSWSTKKEKDFIDNMGTFSKHNGNGRPYLQRLIGYRKGMEQRKDWGAIDPAEVKRYVEYKIACEQLRRGSG